MSDRPCLALRAPRRPPPLLNKPAAKEPSQRIAQTTPAISAFALGDRIAHPQFGDGTITAIEGPRLSITFDADGSKQIIDSYVKRQKK